MKINAIGLAVVTVVAAGCAGEATTDGEAPDAPIILAAADVTVLGTSDRIATVEDLGLRSDGSVVVFNSVAPFFISFAPDGTLLREHGTQGGGPEEFRAPAGFVVGGLDGEAWALDRQRHAFIQISDDEDVWSELPIPQDSLPLGTLITSGDLMGSVVGTARLGNEVVVPRSTARMQDGMSAFWLSVWGADLLAFDPANGAARHLLSLRETIGDPVSLTPVAGGLPFPLWFRLWTVCSESELRIYDRVRNELRGFALDGAELTPTPLPSEYLNSVSPREFAGAVFGLAVAQTVGNTLGRLSAADSLRLLNELVGQIDATPEQLAGLLPRYVDFRCSEDGAMWIQPFDIDRGGLRGGQAWLRVSSDGLTREVTLPDRFDAYRFTAERIWGVQRDELDIASVAWIALPNL